MTESSNHSSSSSSSDDAAWQDSLPYIDYIHEDYEIYAVSLIESEMESSLSNNKTNNNNTNHKNIFLTKEMATPMANNAYQILLKNHGILIPEKPNYNYNYSPPTSSTSSTKDEGEDKNDNNDNDNETKWKEWVQSAKIHLEYQRQRWNDLEIQLNLESKQWKEYNEMLKSGPVAAMSGMVENTRLDLDRINATRSMEQQKEQHEGGGRKKRGIHHLSQKWNELITSNQRLANATASLERDVESLKMELNKNSAVLER